MKPSDTMGPVGFDEFTRHICDEMMFDPEALSPDTLLAEDLDVDSLGLYELMLLVEDLGAEVTEEELANWRTLGDVHRSARRALEGGATGRTEGPQLGSG